MQVNPRGIECALKCVRQSFGPAAALILVFPPAHALPPPSVAFGQRGQIDFAGSDGGGLPIHDEQTLGPHQDGLGIEFAMDHRRLRGEQRGEPGVSPIPDSRQPREAPVERAGELGSALRPTPKVFRVVALEKGERRIVHARLLVEVEAAEPAGRSIQRARLAHGELPSNVAQAHVAIHVFEE